MTPTLRIWQGGQTGVDRGAWLGAQDAGHELRGFGPGDGRDELGPIPLEVAESMTMRMHSSYAQRTAANVSAVHGVLLVVPHHDHADWSPGTALTYRLARYQKLPLWVHGLYDALEAPNAWLHVAWRGVGRIPFNLLVAGPRASKWASGQAVARTVVAGLTVPRWAMVKPCGKENDGHVCERPHGHSGPCDQ